MARRAPKVESVVAPVAAPAPVVEPAPVVVPDGEGARPPFGANLSAETLGIIEAVFVEGGPAQAEIAARAAPSAHLEPVPAAPPTDTTPEAPPAAEAAVKPAGRVRMFVDPDGRRFLGLDGPPATAALPAPFLRMPVLYRLDDDTLVPAEVAKVGAGTVNVLADVPYASLSRRLRMGAHPTPNGTLFPDVTEGPNVGQWSRFA